MFRFYSLLLLAFTLSQCAPSRYACIDLNQKQKKDFRHSRIKSHFVAPGNQHVVGSSDSLILREEYPFLVSLETDPVLPSGQAPGLVPDMRGLEMIAESKHSEKRLSGIESRRIERLKDRLVEVLPPELMEKMELVQDTSITRFDDVYNEAKSLAIISFSSSIASILAIALPVLIFPLIAVGLVTGLISLKRYKKAFNKDYKGLAIAGVIISSAWLALLLAVIIMVILLFSSGWS
ncbi:MAG: DUF4190 domain-containing protein [Marinoscillum sp.]|uniref:DUF4190 domain-containing protein n=1 Tax=Marinoscillum sp. TaxID=2024838 RepID=UPI0032F37C1C